MAENEVKQPRCAECRMETRICTAEDGKGPAFCPTLGMSGVIENSNLEYKEMEIAEFARQASVQEGECYVNRGADNPNARFAVKPRIQETIEFSHKMGYKKLGLAFCMGLKSEAGVLADILKYQGFDVASVVCKAGRTPKEFLGVKDEEKINPGSFESMCSPIAQAKLLNASKTVFNIIMGLCIGHDSLVMKYSEALCTVLVVKDRVTGHNPLAAILQHQAYYRKLSTQQLNKGGFVTVAVDEKK